MQESNLRLRHHTGGELSEHQYLHHCHLLGKAVIAGQISDCEQIAVHQPKLYYKFLKNVAMHLCLLCMYYSGDCIYCQLISGTPSRIRTDTILLLRETPHTNWAIGALVSRDGIEPPFRTS